ncbi:hypothetical protein KC334_g18 [Hortaea werneckii]|nr:hypothetical protein KC334_g18 [Hortaea werneckii]KAI7028416.1 hypothetical protein KC355_g20 [Hortaea werneckii]
MRHYRPERWAGHVFAKYATSRGGERTRSVSCQPDCFLHPTANVQQDGHSVDTRNLLAPQDYRAEAAISFRSVDRVGIRHLQQCRRLRVLLHRLSFVSQLMKDSIVGRHHSKHPKCKIE